MCSTESTQSAISEALNGESVATRTRALFALRGCGPNSPEGVRAVEEVLLSDASALIRHEAAYVLGQMSAHSAIPTLQKVLENENEDVMVRHEAAEALGAIADPSTRPVLEVYARREGVPQEIKETCIIALDRIDHVINGTLPPENKSECTYGSVDPAEPSDTSASVEDLEAQLSDDEIGMYTRYAAMFSLRNKGGEDAVLALCRAMEAEKDSALFRHEIAYVLGQMQHPASIPTLEKFLRKRDEHEMVRHEAAEALGSIASDKAMEILKHFIEDAAQVVRESVHVALDISDYNTSSELHYASTTPSLSSSITQETSPR